MTWCDSEMLGLFLGHDGGKKKNLRMVGGGMECWSREMFLSDGSGSESVSEFSRSALSSVGVQ